MTTELGPFGDNAITAICVRDGARVAVDGDSVEILDAHCLYKMDAGTLELCKEAVVVTSMEGGVFVGRSDATCSRGNFAMYNNCMVNNGSVGTMVYNGRSGSATVTTRGDATRRGYSSIAVGSHKLPAGTRIAEMRTEAGGNLRIAAAVIDSDHDEIIMEASAGSAMDVVGDVALSGGLLAEAEAAATVTIRGSVRVKGALRMNAQAAARITMRGEVRCRSCRLRASATGCISSRFPVVCDSFRKTTASPGSVSAKHVRPAASARGESQR